MPFRDFVQRREAILKARYAQLHSWAQDHLDQDAYEFYADDVNKLYGHLIFEFQFTEFEDHIRALMANIRDEEKTLRLIPKISPTTYAAVITDNINLGVEEAEQLLI